MTGSVALAAGDADCQKIYGLTVASRLRSFLQI